MVIGVVGKIGSGKSAVVKYFKNNCSGFNVVELSCDDIAKELLEDPNLKFNFKNVRAYDFFTNDIYQQEVREKFHPLVFNKIKNMIEQYKSSVDAKGKNTLFIIESALPSALMYEMCDKVIYIKSSFDNSHMRLAKSREYSENQSKVIYDSQKYYEKFYNMADYIIDNNGTKEDFIKKIDEVKDEICIICK